MKVSVISKEAHAKTLYSWLIDNGYDVSMLGDNPTAIPTSTDMVVCRHRSCSSQASALAQSWAKKTGKPVIMENGLKTISRKIERVVKPASNVTVLPTPKPSLDEEKLTTLLEHAQGKTMSWLASRLGMRVDALIPALMEAKRLAEVSNVLALPPESAWEMSDTDETPVADTIEDIQEYASIILEERKTDPFEVQLSVLRHMTDGSIGDDVLRSILGGADAGAEEEQSEEDGTNEGLVQEVVVIPPPDTPAESTEPPASLMAAFEALRQEVLALREELQELKTPRGSVTLDDLIAAGAHVSITPKDDV